ncbi:protein FAR1-RELATED SEQUENCE 8-like [Papaver somniferum]|uniref:protein FAR1-RELATED SEQUENCE 8-like n=1 Tax=Papaver somniferum TaxID=3469 RepID=UPI000E6F7E36|nr:protein FAR1-RELATED SEQUENCE 8-like [Papaver somniferum]
MVMKNGEVNVDDITDLYEDDDEDADYNAEEIDDSNEDDAGYEDEEYDDNPEICIGKIFDTPLGVAEAYKKYAKSLGFAMRKKTQRKNTQGILRSVTYSCNRQGKFKSRYFKPARPSKTYRCGWLASVTARLNNDDKWEVSQFFVKHNHPINVENARHYRCHGFISPPHQSKLNSHNNSYPPLIESYPSLQPKTTVINHTDGRTVNLLLVEGTI